MNKYNTEDYFSVRERRTGKKICDCGDFEDARMMMNLDTPNREIVKNKTLMSPVIDVEMPKALPTTEIVQGASGNSWETSIATGNGPESLPQIKLPESEGISFKP